MPIPSKQHATRKAGSKPQIEPAETTKRLALTVALANAIYGIARVIVEMIKLIQPKL